MSNIVRKVWGDLKSASARGKKLAVAATVFLALGSAWAGSLNYATPYTFVTMAGTVGGIGYNDGSNGVAQFYYPEGVAVGTNGNVYVLDSGASTLRQLAHVGTNWVVTTIAGSAGQSGVGDGTNNSAQFNEPGGVAADNAGNLYVADTQNDTIRRVTHVGTNWAVTTIAGSAQIAGDADGTNGDARFDSPYGIATDSNGNVFVADSYVNCIRRITPMGTNWVVTTIAGYYDSGNPLGSSIDGTNQDAQFAFPTALTVDSVGNIFVVDGGSGVIRKVTEVGTNWVVTTIAGNAANPSGAFDGTNGTIQFNSPFYGIAVDANDNLYVTDGLNDIIRKVSPVGTNWVCTTLAGLLGVADGKDGTGTNATFGAPWGIAVDSSGNLYVSDNSNNDIRMGAIGSLPNLTISPTGPNSVLVSWPGSFGTLQTNASLATGNWGAYSGAVNSSNGTNSVTISPAVGNSFFRLSQ